MRPYVERTRMDVQALERRTIRALHSEEITPEEEQQIRSSLRVVQSVLDDIEKEVQGG